MKIVQVTKEGTVIAASKKQLRRLRSQFEREHCLCFPEFLEPSLLKSVRRKISKAKFRTKIHAASGIELGMKANEATDMLHFILNDPRLFEFLEAVTGCKPVNFFYGRVYSMLPGSNHHHGWHNDNLYNNRLLGVSINLSAGVFQGGSLQLRIKKNKKLIHEVTNSGFGDLVILGRMVPYQAALFNFFEAVFARCPNPF